MVVQRVYSQYVGREGGAEEGMDDDQMITKRQGSVECVEEARKASRVAWRTYRKCGKHRERRGICRGLVNVR